VREAVVHDELDLALEVAGVLRRGVSSDLPGDDHGRIDQNG